MRSTTRLLSSGGIRRASVPVVRAFCGQSRSPQKSVVFALIGRGLIQRFGTSGSALISIGAGVLRWSIMASSTDFLLLAGIQLLHGLTFALMHLTCMTIIDRVIPPSLAATAQTTYNNLCLGIASAFFTSLAGILYGAIGPASFWCAAALCAVRRAIGHYSQYDRWRNNGSISNDGQR